jgi:hypothetical protein
MKLKKGYLWSHSSEKRKRETRRGFEMQMHLDSPTVSRVSVLEGMWELECPVKMSSGNFHVRRDYPSAFFFTVHICISVLALAILSSFNACNPALAPTDFGKLIMT